MQTNLKRKKSYFVRSSFYFVCVLVTIARCASAQTTSFENPPIDYLNAPVTDPVARLAAKIESGEIKLKYDSERGYLPAVLKELEVPVSSQMKDLSAKAPSDEFRVPPTTWSTIC